MKVLLINPEFPDTYWSFRHALPFEGKRSALPPLGLLTVSSLLPKSWERRLIDLNVRISAGNAGETRPRFQWIRNGPEGG